MKKSCIVSSGSASPRLQSCSTNSSQTLAQQLPQALRAKLKTKKPFWSVHNSSGSRQLASPASLGCRDAQIKEGQHLKGPQRAIIDADKKTGTIQSSQKSLMGRETRGGPRSAVGLTAWLPVSAKGSLTAKVDVSLRLLAGMGLNGIIHLPGWITPWFL